MNEPLLPIGQFARLCRLSVKQLRHYDELGLLPPAHVDPGSGYRYYRADQARDALSIGLLRSLDVPLTTIGRLLSGADVARTLGEVRDRLEADLLRRQRTLATLDRVLAEGMPRVEVRVVREPTRHVAVVRGSGTPDRIGAVTTDCVNRLVGTLAAAGVVARGPLTGLFPLDLTRQVTVAVAAEVDGNVPGAATEVLGGGMLATATHIGPYDQTAFTAHGLLAWIGDHGHVPGGPLREVYVSDPRETAPERLITELKIELEDPHE